MLPSTVDEHARRRYATALYHCALLRDPRSQRAGAAAITALRTVGWPNIPLDDQTEGLLVASLPPLPRHGSLPKMPLLDLPAAFWRLPGQARLALGLRLLRGMTPTQIAGALDLNTTAAHALLVDSLAYVMGQPLPLPSACEEYWIARLSDPGAERAHLLTCPLCQDASPAHERMEQTLSDAFARVVAILPLPPAVEAALSTSTSRQAPPRDRRVRVVQLAAAGIIAIGLLLILWPARAATVTRSGSAPQAPAAIIDAARAAYSAVPPGNAILHRRWLISAGQQFPAVQADEWVDQARPARHRMQLLADRTTVEWQSGDGQGRLMYMSTIAASLCGEAPVGVVERTNERASWAINASQQAAMRSTRWQHGLWATGLHYLNLAAGGATLRNLGVTGRGADAMLTLTATGRAISGTLILRFDSAGRALREVRELHTNNGQTQERVAWQLVMNETLDARTPVIEAYPDKLAPPLSPRTLPIIDNACPLTAVDQTLSMPRLLSAPAHGLILGLPALPAGLDHAMIIGPASPAATDPTVFATQLAPNDWETVYIGPGKRLAVRTVHRPVASLPATEAGPWNVYFLPDELPALVTADLGTRATPGPPALPDGNGGTVAHVVAEGWSRTELLAVLKTVRPLALEDWLAMSDHVVEPLPLPPVLAAHLQTLLEATHIRPGQIRHQTTLEITRQAPFFTALTDPYHVPAGKWPPVRRDERWTEYDVDGTAQRALRIISDIGGHVLAASWYDSDVVNSYEALTGSLTSQQVQAVGLPSDSDSDPLTGTFSWQWTSRSDGTLAVEQSQLLPSYAPLVAADRSVDWPVDNWTADLASPTGQVRKTFDRNGHLQREDIVGRGGVTIGQAGADVSLPITTIPISITIRSRVVEKDEWLPRSAAGVFDWQPPAGTQQSSRDALEQLHSHGIEQVGSVQSLPGAASSMAFPIWGWFPRGTDGTLPASFRSATLIVPTMGNTRPVLQGPTDKAISVGAGVELEYDVDSHPVSILEGPAAALRPLLQQSLPQWTSAEQRTVPIAGGTQELWVMRGDRATNNDYNRWLVFEQHDTLFFLHTVVPDDELDRLIAHIGEFQQVRPSTEP